MLESYSTVEIALLGSAALLLVFGVGLAGSRLRTVFAHHQLVSNSVEVSGDLEYADLEVSRPNRYTETYHPVARYQYDVDGETYTGTDIYPGKLEPASTDRDEARDLVKSLSDQEELPVYVDGSNPAESYLIEESDTSLVTVVAVGLGLMAIVASVFLIVALV